MPLIVNIVPKMSIYERTDPYMEGKFMGFGLWVPEVMHLWVMHYGLHFPANQLGGRQNLWPITGYQLWGISSMGYGRFNCSGKVVSLILTPSGDGDGLLGNQLKSGLELTLHFADEQGFADGRLLNTEHIRTA